MLKALLIVGTGSFIGGVLRFALGRFVQSLVHSVFPWGTFVVNILGCLIIGLLFGLTLKEGLVSTSWKLFLFAGICGGFTTFSTFSLENLSLLRDGYLFYFFLYSGLSVFLGLAATAGGYFMVKTLL